jgi:hypothetical protein
MVVVSIALLINLPPPKARQVESSGYKLLRGALRIDRGDKAETKTKSDNANVSNRRGMDQYRSTVEAVPHKDLKKR